MKILTLLFVSVILAYDAPYCVVTPFVSECYFYTLATCQSAAQLANGVCIENPNR